MKLLVNLASGLTFLIAISLLSISPCFAQPAEQGSMSYKELSAKIIENEQLINQLYTTMPLGFPERQKLQLAKIDELVANNKKLKTLVNDAAMSSFQTAPAENPQAARIVYQTLVRKLDPQGTKEFFDPKKAQEIGLMMLEADLAPEAWPEGVSYPNLLYQVFRASFAQEDFTTAESMLEKLEALKVDLRPEIRQQLEVVKEHWEKETLVRRFETNNDDLPRVKFETTEGDFIVELYENHAPQTVGNFISLVEKNFYNDMNFFVVKPGEYALIGCSQNDGSSDPGYKIASETDREQIRYHFSGTLSMVENKQGEIGSQFLISHQANPKFDGRYTVFGRIIEGMDVVLRLKPVNQQANPLGLASKSMKATVLRKRDHDYVPTIIE